MADRFEPGGVGTAPAVTVAGRTVSYAGFRSLVEQQPPALADLAGLGVLDTLAAVFAAARFGSAVLVRPAHIVPVLPSDLPPDAFLIALTSGTSGPARGVLRTADSWTSSFRPLADLAGLTSDDTVLLTGPLHSTLHLFAAVHTLWLGAHLTDEPATATAAHMVPTVLADLVAAAPPRLRTAVVAGAHLPASIEQRAASAGMRVVEYYGAAELSFVAARVAPATLTAFPGVDLRVVDGKLQARSPYLALARLPSSAADPLLPVADSDGFATAGDLATIDTAGGVVVRGRGDAAITTGGHTVLAEDVESAIGGVAGVVAVAVVGVPHVRLGQVLAAAVELAPGADLRAVRHESRRILLGPSLPRIWQPVVALPRTDAGKIARSLVVELLSPPHPASGAPRSGRPAIRSAR